MGLDDRVGVDTEQLTKSNHTHKFEYFMKENGAKDQLSFRESNHSDIGCVAAAVNLLKT